MIKSNSIMYSQLRVQPMVSRELFTIHTKLVQQMRPWGKTGGSPYVIDVKRDMHIELFAVIKKLMENCTLNVSTKETRASITISIRSEIRAKALFNFMNMGEEKFFPYKNIFACNRRDGRGKLLITETL
ncbi:unnamed protein product [Owenia fusiformis]|uniref:Uncharacterized protein n=1 Tax=Owenia fusiformis TaxID=6347 RepID=A0A8S4N011_OWEFU|nr:unnamed protein product [Owenia fusiformis]